MDYFFGEKEKVAYLISVKVAVDPEEQGKGIGGNILEPTLSQADYERAPVWTLTSSERAVVCVFNYFFLFF